ncbi:MAG: hypothetical protein OXI91_06065, partial [Chloroflexota bacterium]|nr:hypothetical protein [Chloroflexota bacterium]
MGLEVVFQPEVNGANPDFYISDERRFGAYVEAGAMFNHPLETELSHASKSVQIWEAFKGLQSHDFTVRDASCSGNPGNASPRLVRHEIQLWIDQLDVKEVLIQYYCHNVMPFKTFQFENWSVAVELEPKSPEDRDRLGAQAVKLAGFSGGWSDIPAERLKSKLKEKFSQVRKSGDHCIVAITGRLEGFREDDIQRALLGENREYSFRNFFNNRYPYLRACGQNGNIGGVKDTGMG